VGPVTWPEWREHEEIVVLEGKRSMSMSMSMRVRIRVRVRIRMRMRVRMKMKMKMRKHRRGKNGQVEQRGATVWAAKKCDDWTKQK